MLSLVCAAVVSLWAAGAARGAAVDFASVRALVAEDAVRNHTSRAVTAAAWLRVPAGPVKRRMFLFGHAEWESWTAEGAESVHFQFDDGGRPVVSVKAVRRRGCDSEVRSESDARHCWGNRVGTWRLADDVWTHVIFSVSLEPAVCEAVVFADGELVGALELDRDDCAGRQLQSFPASIGGFPTPTKYNQQRVGWRDAAGTWEDGRAFDGELHSLVVFDEVLHQNEFSAAFAVTLFNRLPFAQSVWEPVFEFAAPGSVDPTTNRLPSVGFVTEMEIVPLEGGAGDGVRIVDDAPMIEMRPTSATASTSSATTTTTITTTTTTTTRPEAATTTTAVGATTVAEIPRRNSSSTASGDSNTPTANSVLAGGDGPDNTVLFAVVGAAACCCVVLSAIAFFAVRSGMATADDGDDDGAPIDTEMAVAPPTDSPYGALSVGSCLSDGNNYITTMPVSSTADDTYGIGQLEL